jgi:glycerol-3-phosphate acyltransferase PlsY
MNLEYILAIAVGYLLGSIPMGYVMGRLYGIDIRNYGSGRTGGTNLARIVGWPKTIPVVIGDPLKAAIAVLLARALTQSEVGAVLAALAALAGHNWPLYIGFRGGRGVGPVAGALFVFVPGIIIIAGAAGILIALVTRYVSLGSICGSALAIILSIAAYATGNDRLEHLVFIVIACSLIILVHKDNIHRLLNGTERKLGERVPTPAGKPGQ